MNTLTIDLAKGKELYHDATGHFKDMLEKTFGKEKLILRAVTDRIKTWADVAAEKGMDPSGCLPYPEPKNNRERAINAFFKLDIIAELLREGVTLDWTNSNQKKWFAWFNEYTPGAGFRFYAAAYDWAYTDARGGARLCVDTQEKANFFGRQFIDIWNDYLNPIN